MKTHQLSFIEASMRTVIAVQDAYRRDKDFTMSEVAELLNADFGIPTKTCYRYIRHAVDALGIHYDRHSAERMNKRSIRIAEGMMAAQMFGLPTRRRRAA